MSVRDDDPAAGARCAGGGPTEADLSAWLEGDLDPADRAGMDAHLAACEHCRAAAEALRALVARCREAPRPCPGEDCVRRAIEAARDELLRRHILR